MTQLIDIIGMGAEGVNGLPAELRRRIEDASFVAGGRRHLAEISGKDHTLFVIADNLPELATELARRFRQERCVVLASGDPLFFGVGVYLCGTLGATNLRIEPALSAMQLAFARAAIPWQNAILASVHGRDLRKTLLPLLGRRLIGLFTADGASPAKVARFFLERGAKDYDAVVAEDLGTNKEQVRRFQLDALAQEHFSPLNFLVLQRLTDDATLKEIESRRAMCPGIPDQHFDGPDSPTRLMTRQEVRSVLLGKMLKDVAPGETFWDIGAGLGSVAVEMALLHPEAEVIAVERHAGRAAYLRANRERFGALNIRVLEGEAPDALKDEDEPPRQVFIGGSAGGLIRVLDLCADRLVDGGILLANFVTLEHFALMFGWLRDHGWPIEVTELHIARSDSLAGLTGLKPERGVFIVRTAKPERSNG